MNAQSAVQKKPACPSCGSAGHAVGRETLRALLRPEYAQTIPPPDEPPGDMASAAAGGCKPSGARTGFRFCPSPGCDVVYFAEDGPGVFTKHQLRVAVGIKEKSGQRPLCYCFGHSVATIKEELRTKGQSSALADIRQKMKELGCRCHVTNPSGTCCLGSVAKGIQIAKEELEMANAEKPTQQGVASNRAQRSAPHLSARGAGTVAWIGTAVAALAASSCCWLPLVWIALGLSGAGIAAAVEAFRPVFVVLAFGFLGAAFYFTWRERKNSAGRHDTCCSAAPGTPGGGQAPAGKRPLRRVALGRAALWVVAVLAAAMLVLPHYVPIPAGPPMPSSPPGGASRTLLQIEGLTCQGCAAVAADAIRKVPGVVAAEVDYRTGQAVVATDPCCPVPRDQILAALKQAGYTAAFAEPQE